MARADDIILRMDDSLLILLTSTRLVVCRAKDCKNHVINTDPSAHYYGCGLKRIDTGDKGQCVFYEPKES